MCEKDSNMSDSTVNLEYLKVDHLTEPETDISSLSYSSSQEDEQDTSACRERLQKLYVDNRTLLLRIQELEDINNQVSQLYQVSIFQLALRRLPALLVTLLLEMCGGLIIHQLHEVISSLTLIVSFMPAISALSGNLGLQAGANTIRGLGIGIITKKNYGRNIIKEIKAGLITASTVAVIISAIGMLWAYVDRENLVKKPDNLNCAPALPYAYLNSPQVFNETAGSIEAGLDHFTTDFNSSRRNSLKEGKVSQDYLPVLFGAVIFIGTWISMMVSTVNGACTPTVAHMLKIDPAKVAGPLETAFQDIVGQSFLLGLSYVAFHHITDLI